jgi:hypothetical protein
MTSKTLGFIGVAAGSHMSRRLVAAGHKVCFDAEPRRCNKDGGGANGGHSRRMSRHRPKL